MMPVTDGHKISRAKLAYIIDATAAPICMIAPISSWAAAVSGMVDEGVYSGIELFVRAIPYNYYSLLTIVFVIGMALMGFDYGPMVKHERNARERVTCSPRESAWSMQTMHPKVPPEARSTIC